jgi:hypothetical protein
VQQDALVACKLCSLNSSNNNGPFKRHDDDITTTITTISSAARTWLGRLSIGA